MRRAHAPAKTLSMPGNAQRAVSNARRLKQGSANAGRSGAKPKGALDARGTFTRGQDDARRVPATMAGTSRAARRCCGLAARKLRRLNTASDGTSISRTITVCYGTRAGPIWGACTGLAMPKKITTPWPPHRVESASFGSPKQLSMSCQLFMTQTSPEGEIARSVCI